MRRLNWPIIACLIFWLLVGIGCNKSMFYRENAQDFESWALSMKAPSKYQTMHNINEWMHQHMKYEADGLIDNPKPYLETWWQTGDCEDWAIVAIEAMSVCGYNDFWLESVWYGDSGHTVCTDGNHHLGNWGLYYIPKMADKSDYWNVANSVSAGTFTEYTVRDIHWSIVEKGSK